MVVAHALAVATAVAAFGSQWEANFALAHVGWPLLVKRRLT